MPNIEKEKDIWLAISNTDLTEGRGSQVIVAVCEAPETAHRLGFKKSVMGSNCPVEKAKAYQIDNQWYIPGHVIGESKEDTTERLAREAREAAVAKAKMLGLSDDEIKAMTGKK